MQICRKFDFSEEGKTVQAFLFIDFLLSSRNLVSRIFRYLCVNSPSSPEQFLRNSPDTARHFARHFYLILFVNVKQSKLIYAMP